MIIPRVGTDGVRQTVNANLTTAQKVWNLRSALNVAALNCLDLKHAPILENYKVLLKSHASALAAANRTLASEFRQKYGATYRDVQDSYMTQVYNYFALPPAIDEFCDMSLTVSNELSTVPKGGLDAFAATALPRIEGVFENFFRAYEQYRIDVAAWDARYGQTAVPTTVTRYSNPLDPSVNSAVSPAPASSVTTVEATPAPPSASPVVNTGAAYGPPAGDPGR